VLTYEILHGTAQRYLDPLVCDQFNGSRYGNRSASTDRQAGHHLNCPLLPVEHSRLLLLRHGKVTSLPTLSAFHKRLKTHLFCQSHPDNINYTFCLNPHSGFEVALLIRPLYYTNNADFVLLALLYISVRFTIINIIHEH